jgi:hypothetical protein
MAFPIAARSPGYTVRMRIDWRRLALVTFLVGLEGRIAPRAVGGREFDDPAIVAQLRTLLRP